MYKNKRLLAIIPARGGSKGIKLKNLKKINKISLIGHVSKIVKKIKFIDLSLVSTDHPKIIKEAKKYNLKILFRRPKKLSGDKIGDFSVIKHTLLNAEKKTNLKYDIILFLQPTSPLRKVKDIKKVLEIIVKKRYDSVWSISPINFKNHYKKQLLIKNNKLKFAYPKGDKILARQQLEQTYYRNGAVYALTRNCILKKGRLLTNNSGCHVVRTEQISIDNKEDIKLANEYLKNQK